MIMNEKKSKIISIILVISVLVFAFIEELYLKPGYLVKSIIKVSTFGGIILLYAFMAKKKLTEVINLHKIKKFGVLLGCIALFFIGIGILFLIFKNNINLESIRQSLVTKEGLTKENCLFAFAYIIFINSFLEEAFFRGFISGMLGNKIWGYVVSAVLFSIYHIGIIGGWFNPFVFIICVVGLAIVGLFLQWVSNHFKTILASYLVHASANVAINIIGALLLFGVLK